MCRTGCSRHWHLRAGSWLHLTLVRFLSYLQPILNLNVTTAVEEIRPLWQCTPTASGSLPQLRLTSYPMHQYACHGNVYSWLDAWPVPALNGPVQGDHNVTLHTGPD